MSPNITYKPFLDWAQSPSRPEAEQAAIAAWPHPITDPPETSRFFKDGLGLDAKEVADVLYKQLRLSFVDVVNALSEDDGLALSYEQQAKVLLGEGAELAMGDPGDEQPIVRPYKPFIKWAQSPERSDQEIRSIDSWRHPITNAQEAARFFLDGVSTNYYGVAKALYDELRLDLNKVGQALYAETGLDLSEAETAIVLHKGLGLSPAQVAKVFRDGLHFYNEEIAEILHSEFNLEAREVANALSEGLDLSKEEIQEALSKGLGAAEEGLKI
jgi:hypothetical protein